MKTPNLYALVDKEYDITMVIINASLVKYYKKHYPAFDIKPVTSIGTTRIVGESGQMYNAHKVYHDDKVSGEVSYLGIEATNGEIDLEDFKRKLS